MCFDIVGEGLSILWINFEYIAQMNTNNLILYFNLTFRKLFLEKIRGHFFQAIVVYGNSILIQL